MTKKDYIHMAKVAGLSIQEAMLMMTPGCVADLYRLEIKARKR